MILNLKVIILTIIALGILSYILNIILSKIFFPGVERISLEIAKYAKGKYILLAMEVLFILLVVTHALLFLKYTTSPNSLLFVFSSFFITLFFVADITYQIRKKCANLPSLFILIKKGYNKQNYFMNRSKLFFEELISIFFLMVALVVSLTFLVQLKWPHETYFIGYVLIPVYAVLWSYFNTKLRFRPKESIRFRRIIFYFFIAVLSINECFDKYKQILESEKITMTIDYQSLFSYAGVVIFLALDRVIKELSDDKNDFDKVQNKIN
ncbi:hypothetical protein ACFVS2_11475 [Brevibacillus sp. NPDC058079]|uniref:hypothetical protein n=1 Tax=Brevibacillus sp. NPDC058079 TaxID=3346330 RepID=UPI0036EC2A25